MRGQSKSSLSTVESELSSKSNLWHMICVLSGILWLNFTSNLIFSWISLSTHYDTSLIFGYRKWRPIDWTTINDEILPKITGDESTQTSERKTSDLTPLLLCLFFTFNRWKLRSVLNIILVKTISSLLPFSFSYHFALFIYSDFRDFSIFLLWDHPFGLIFEKWSRDAFNDSL